MTVPTLIGILLVVFLIIAIRMFMKRSRDQRIAHEARLRAMAHLTLAAAKKKQAAEAAAAAKKEAETAAAAPAPAAVSREERECPFCAELILKKARVCKHCGRDVEPLA